MFADDGAQWKRRKNMDHDIRKVQGAIDEVVECFYQKKNRGRDELGGVIFDAQLTWADHMRI